MSRTRFNIGDEVEITDNINNDLGLRRLEWFKNNNEPLIIQKIVGPVYFFDPNWRWGLFDNEVELVVDNTKLEDWV
jgi:hypothetical protein